MPKYDNNIIVIGAGSGGLVAALIASAVKAKVTLIEKHAMGGDCLNTGCVPSKALLRTAKLVRDIKQADKYGLASADFTVDFAKVMQRVQAVIAQVAPHDSVERFTDLGVNVIKGEAQILTAHEVQVNGEVLSTKNIIIATGARPIVPSLPGLLDIDYLTSDNLWQLKTLPDRLAVVGGGPIGCEMAQAFAMLGSKVTIINRSERIMPREDVDVAEFISARLQAEGIDILSNCNTSQIREGKYIEYDSAGVAGRLEFDKILLAVGRTANVSGFGLEELGVKLNPNKTIVADNFLRTNIKNIFVVGDVTGPYQFTHSAAHQAWFAAVNALFGRLKKFKVDYRVLPKVTFTSPEVATVGLNESVAQAQSITYETSLYDIGELDRALADSAAEGWVKVLTVPGKDKILGVIIVAEHAGDMLAEFVLAMKYNLGLNKILGTIHAYPTWVEANKYVAGEWKKAHAPQKLLKYVAKFHKFMR